MPLVIVPFTLAIMGLARLPLPVDPALLCVGLPLAIYGTRQPRLQPLAGLFLGLFYGLHVAEQKLGAELPDVFTGQDLVVTGVIIDLPWVRSDSIRFSMKLEQGETLGGSSIDAAKLGKIVVSCYDCSGPFNPGEVWELKVRLTPPVGSANPGLFDYEGWQFMQGIAARGYIREPQTATLVGQRLLTGFQHRLRSRIRSFLEEHVSGDHLGLLLALAIGASSAIEPEVWQVLSNTGTNHLFVVSGLHIGLVSALTYRVTRGLALSVRLAGLLTLCLSGLYAAIAGLGLPVQRAWIMACVVVVSSMLARRAPVSSMFFWALAGVLLLEPFAVLSTGFWLSFTAVFSLIFSMTARYPVVWGTPWMSWCMDAARTQWAVTAGTLPLLVYLLYQWAWLGLPANAVAIPWLSCLVVPPLLLVTILIPISTDLAAGLLSGVEWSLHLIWQYLAGIAGLDLVFRRAQLGIPALGCACLGVLFLLAPRGLAPRWLSLLCLAPVFSAETLRPRDLEVTFLDVGQGLSVLVRLHDEIVLYDAGPKFRGGFDAGEAIVSPYLRALGISTLDHLIISHADHDHAGGAPSIIENFPIRRIHTSGDFPGESCHEASSWRVDEYDLSVFSAQLAGGGNDRSCLFHVGLAGQDLLLLTGDIEAASEFALVSSRYADVAIMSVPHHGSLSSSSPALLNRLRPNVAVVSAGRNNAFGHPHIRVMDRYAARHVRTFNTADDGAVTVTIDQQSRVQVNRSRTVFDRLWHARAP